MRCRVHPKLIAKFAATPNGYVIKQVLENSSLVSLIEWGRWSVVFSPGGPLFGIRQWDFATVVSCFWYFEVIYWKSSVCHPSR